MRIALIGYGSMGREVERQAEPLGMKITEIFDINRPLSTANADTFDVAIDFSWPDAVVTNVQTAAQLHVPIVLGTTGWYDSIDEVRSIVDRGSIGCVWGSNFNIGTHLFLRIVQRAAELLNPHTAFDVAIHEWHHNRKRDSPSGTALTTAAGIISRLDRKKSVATETQHGVIDPSALHITSTRVGDVIGRHQVTIDGPFESIDIVHTAKNRQGFAQGALLAAKWIQQRKGLYDVTALIDEL